jgi:hypothetical protein
MYVKIKKQKGRYQISSSHEMFKNKELVMLLGTDKIIFKMPRLDFTGKTYKPLTQFKNKLERFIYIDIDYLPEGKFEIEENNEEVVIYFENGK